MNDRNKGLKNCDKKFGDLTWCAEDILSIRPEFSEAEAVAFLERNEGNIRDRLCELGWEVIDTLLDIEKWDKENK